MCTSFCFSLSDCLTTRLLLVEDLLDLLDQTLLLVILGTGTVLTRLGLSNGVVFGSTLSTSQGAVTRWAIGVGLVVSIIVGVGTLASSARVGSELRVLSTKLSISSVQCGY